MKYTFKYFNHNYGKITKFVYLCVILFVCESFVFQRNINMNVDIEIGLFKPKNVLI